MVTAFLMVMGTTIMPDPLRAAEFATSYPSDSGKNTFSNRAELYTSFFLIVDEIIVDFHDDGPFFPLRSGACSQQRRRLLRIGEREPHVPLIMRQAWQERQGG